MNPHRIISKPIGRILLGIALSAIAATATAELPSGQGDDFPRGNVTRLIEGSYMVMFNPPNGAEPPLVVPPAPSERGLDPFADHLPPQAKVALGARLGLRNAEVVKIFRGLNAAHVHMDAEEAARIARDPRVKWVEQDATGTVATTVQFNPGWGLDRLDSATPALNGEFHYDYRGAGRTVYVLDTGLALSRPLVAAEFEGRAEIVYDVNDGDGDDCYNHGTAVAGIVGGKKYGVAKEVSLKIAKITKGCSEDFDIITTVDVLDRIATHAPRGTIVNWSMYLYSGHCAIPYHDTKLTAAIKRAHDQGIIVVVSAGNDGCNTANYSPTEIPESFVVGATSNTLIPGADAKADFSRTGWNISTFAPGQAIQAIDRIGFDGPISGTSFAAPYVAGMFAVACEQAGSYCSTADVAEIYANMRATGTLNTVTDPDGKPLTGATSRFIHHRW